MMNQNVIELTYEEVVSVINNIINNHDRLLGKEMKNFSHFTVLLKKILVAMDGAINNAQEINSLGEMEIYEFIESISSFPIILLKDYDEELVTDIQAIILLASNYTKLFYNEELEKVVEAIYNLFLMKNSFTNLILITDILLNRYNNVTTSQNNYFNMSKKFVASILKNEEN